MSVEGKEELIRQLGSLERVPDAAARVGVSWGIKLVESSARALCPVNDGELRDSIASMVDSKQEVIRGSCYTNKSHAPYVEFGTGQKGQESHEGISPMISPTYTKTPWWIHESQIDKKTAEEYHMFAIKTKNGIFYRSSGQAAQPFMYPALKNNEDVVIKQIEKGWNYSLRKEIK